MRVLPLLLLATLARAEPYVRWIDPTGELKRAAVAEVIEESLTGYKLRLAGGELFETPARPVLELVREDVRDPAQKRLLDARRAAFAGERPDAVRPELEKFLAAEGPAWMREYALAARTILAERAREPEAGARIEAFLKQHQASRFAGQVLAARARLDAAAQKSFVDRTNAFGAAFLDLGKRRVALIVQFEPYLDSVRAASMDEQLEFGRFLATVDPALSDEVDGKGAVSFLVAESCRVRALLIGEVRSREARIREGFTPAGPAVKIRKLRDQAEFLLPEIACDTNLELGRSLAACRLAADAKAAFEKAQAVAPDAARRAAAAAELARLRDASR